MIKLTTIAIVLFSMFLGILIGILLHPVDSELIIKPGGQSELDLKGIKDMHDGKILVIRVRYENPTEVNTDDESQIKVSP